MEEEKSLRNVELVKTIGAA